MKKKTRLSICILAAAFSIFSLTGCMGRDRFNEDQTDEIVEKGKPILEEFINSLPAEKIENARFAMSDAAKDGSLIWGGRYLSNSVMTEFVADGRCCRATVDLETGIIYSNYYMFPLADYIAEQLKPYCEKYGFTGNYRVENVSVSYLFHSHGVKADKKGDKLTDTYVLIENMIPSTFNQQDEAERAAAFLKNAPISDFRIYYDIEEDEIFDPRILSDYLSETGNYDAEEDDFKRTIAEYSIIGSRKGNKFPSEGVFGYNIDLFYEDDIKNMKYSMFRKDCLKNREFCFVYTGAVKKGDMDSFEKDLWEEHEFPLEINENKISFYGSDGYGNVSLRFEEKPPYTFTRTRYNNGVAGETEKLIAEQNEAGVWYLTLESRPRAYLNSYIFDANQDLEFE